MTQGIDPYQMVPPPVNQGFGGPGSGPAMVPGPAPLPALDVPQVIDPNRHPMDTGAVVDPYAAPQQPHVMQYGAQPGVDQAMLAQLQDQISQLSSQNLALQQVVTTQQANATSAAPAAPHMNPEEKALRMRIDQTTLHNEQVRKIHSHVEAMRDELITYEQKASEQHIVPVEPLRRKLWNLIHGTMEGYEHGESEQARASVGSASGHGAGAHDTDTTGNSGAVTIGHPEPDGQAGQLQHGPELPVAADRNTAGSGEGRPVDNAGPQDQREDSTGSVPQGDGRVVAKPFGIPGVGSGGSEVEPGLTTDIDEYAVPDPSGLFMGPLLTEQDG